MVGVGRGELLGAAAAVALAQPCTEIPYTGGVGELLHYQAGRRRRAQPSRRRPSRAAGRVPAPVRQGFLPKRLPSTGWRPGTAPTTMDGMPGSARSASRLADGKDGSRPMAEPPHRIRRQRPGVETQSELVEERAGDAASFPIGYLPDRRASVAPPYWLGLQRAVGNQAVSRMLRADRVVQRDAPASKTSGTSNDEGGVADTTNLEQDMRDVLLEWQSAALQGVGQFVTNTLSSRLDDLESGSWSTFLLGLLGNTIWAAVAFTPAGMAGSAFAISMAGISLAAAPTIPHKSKSAIPKVHELMDGYVNGIFNQVNGKLREKASALLGQYPGITRYHALAEFVRHSLAPGTYTLDPSYGSIPTLSQGVISDRFVQLATQRLELARTVGTHTVSGDLPSATSTTVTEVAWIRGPTGPLRLAILESTWLGDDTGTSVPQDSGTTHLFKEWVAPGNVDAAIAQWATSRSRFPMTYAASQIDRLSG